MIDPRRAKLLDQYDAHLKDLSRSGPVAANEKPEEREKRIAGLLADFYKFDDYYFGFPGKKPYSRFHKQVIRKFLGDNKCFIALKAYRGFSKSSLAAKLLIFLHFKGEIKNVGYFSRNQDKAMMLLASVKNAFEKNTRLRQDFGVQEVFGSWEDRRFKTKKGCWFKAFGSGQSPRGEKTEDDERFDCEIFDDFDDVEVCLNPERLDKAWKYIEGDCFGAFSMLGGPRRVLFANNQIDEDCIIERAYQLAKTDEKHGLPITVNILDDNGQPSWKEALSLEEAQDLIRLMGDEADTELFNRPARKGKHWKKEHFVFKKLPPLNRYKFLLAYLDGGFKKTATSDTKALVCIGYLDGQYHVRKVYCDNVDVTEMIGWHYDLHDYLSKRNASAQWYMEEVFLLDLLYKDFAAEAKLRGMAIPICGDTRKKPDKDLRILSTFGYFQRGSIVFDESLEHDPHMKRLIDQYVKFRVGGKTKRDGPDAMEGDIFLLNQLSYEAEPPTYGKPRSSVISRF